LAIYPKLELEPANIPFQCVQNCECHNTAACVSPSDVAIDGGNVLALHDACVLLGMIYFERARYAGIASCLLSPLRTFLYC